MKTGILFVVAMLLGVNVTAQHPVKGEQKQFLLEKIAESSKKIETLQCDFVQEKTSTLVTEKAVANGVLRYQSPLMLHWEYTTPAPSTLILSGNNAVLLNKDSEKVGDDKMIKQLGKLIISIINGDGIKNSKQFSTEIFELEGHQLLVILIPVQKRIKAFYTAIELKIDKNTFLASEIVMNEKSGDKITVFLSNKILNKEVSQSEFAIK